MKNILIVLALSAAPGCAAFDAISSDTERSEEVAEAIGDSVGDVASAAGIPGGVWISGAVTSLAAAIFAWRRKKASASSSSAQA